MRRVASIGWFIAAILVALSSTANAGERCWFDPEQGQIICEDEGGNDPAPGPEPRPGKRYLYVTNRAGFGECHYWSNQPGGIDAWDPANDPVVISIVLRIPRCPATPAVDAEATAWSIFRSWTLAAPAIGLEPEAVGITGLPTFLTSVQPAPITHQELLPDGRTLRVRADVTTLSVDWGDGTRTTHAPESADPYPTGAVTHMFTLKTCTADYREHHPSGGLCHPTLDSYPVTATFTWIGSYNAGSGWIDLGALDRTSSTTYEVDEARGIPIG
jgi:hypothetical protein